MTKGKPETKTSEEIEKEIKDIRRKQTLAKWRAVWQITKAVMFPIVVVLGVVAFIVYGALFAVLGESLKKIVK